MCPRAGCPPQPFVHAPRLGLARAQQCRQGVPRTGRLLRQSGVTGVTGVTSVAARVDFVRGACAWLFACVAGRG
eukprot:365733-Chlamydomonas_euryale.AAC.30